MPARREVAERDLPVTRVRSARGPQPRAIANVDVGPRLRATRPQLQRASGDRQDRRGRRDQRAQWIDRRWQCERQRRQRYFDAARGRGGDAGERAIVRVDLRLRRVRGRQRRLEEVEQMLAERKARELPDGNHRLESKRTVGSRRRIDADLRRDQPQRQVPELLRDDQWAEGRRRIRERTARGELREHAARTAVHRAARARKLNGGRTHADADEHRLAGGRASILRQRQLVPARIGIDRGPRREYDGARDVAVRVDMQRVGDDARRADTALVAGLHRRRRAVPADLKDVLARVRAGRGIARRRDHRWRRRYRCLRVDDDVPYDWCALGAGARTGGPAGRARVGPLRQQQRLRAVAAHRHGARHEIAVGVEGQADVDRRPLNLRVHRPASHAARERSATPEGSPRRRERRAAGSPPPAGTAPRPQRRQDRRARRPATTHSRPGGRRHRRRRDRAPAPTPAGW